MAKQVIRIDRGRSDVEELTIEDVVAKEIYELQSGEILRFGVKKNINDPNCIFIKECTDKDADENGTYAIYITPEDTINLPVGKYYYDIGIQSGEDYWPVIPWTEFVIGPNATEKE